MVARADLLPGLQAAQCCHALRLFCADHKVEENFWYEKSNNLVLLQVPDRESLVALQKRAFNQGVSVSLFCEPDLGNEPTALTLGFGAKGLVSNFSLLLKGHTIL